MKDVLLNYVKNFINDLNGELGEVGIPDHDFEEIKPNEECEICDGTGIIVLYNHKRLTCLCKYKVNLIY